MMTGSSSSVQAQRPGYLFRRLRPTAVIEPNLARTTHVRCTLCLHPIGYYETAGRARCARPTTSSRHLMMMRGDEPMFWRKANQHPPHGRRQVCDVPGAHHRVARAAGAPARPGAAERAGTLKCVCGATFHFPHPAQRRVATGTPATALHGAKRRSRHSARTFPGPHSRSLRSCCARAERDARKLESLRSVEPDRANQRTSAAGRSASTWQGNGSRSRKKCAGVPVSTMYSIASSDSEKASYAGTPDSSRRALPN
jgi:hypothetical protein